jgi:hypothetical protein
MNTYDTARGWRFPAVSVAAAIGLLLTLNGASAQAAGTRGSGGGGGVVGGGRTVTGGGAGGTITAAPAEPLPPLAWESLDSGLEKAKSAGKPLIVVFTTKDFRGPGTFEDRALRDALTGSGAVIARVLPPEQPAVPAGASAEQVRDLQDGYAQALAKYQDVARKYEVAGVNPTQVFLSPQGEKLTMLAAPSQPDVKQQLLTLPKLVEWHKANKDRKDGGAAAVVGLPAKG